MVIVKTICLFLSIFFGFINIAKMFYKESISARNFLAFAVGMTGFIIIQFNLI
ncbi:MAG: hypothetical protein Q4D02_01895 [Clostridia bacterium]|nr:hypothetical protein [Clostridia bacterium]